MASWHCIANKAFASRPVFLFSDRIIVHAPVLPGSSVDLFAKIEQLEDRTFVFSGSASVDGKLVQTITSCSGYFMPLGDLEDPAVTEDRFGALTSPAGLVLEDARRGFQ